MIFRITSMSEETKRKDRPGDQPLPRPNDGPSMHDLVCADLWRDGAAGKLEDAIIVDLQARKQLGLDRYKSLLQANNGRDAGLDLYEELQDAAVYARQLVEERGDADSQRIYLAVLGLLLEAGDRHHG